MMRVVLSGPFCCGKTTMRNMMEEDPDLKIPKLIDHATRPMRPEESEGNPYHFISLETCKENINRDKYHEVSFFCGHYYCVPKRDLLKKKWSLDTLSTSWPLYQKIEGVIGIYLNPPNLEELRRRAKQRGDSNDKIEKRIEALKDEKPDLFIHQVSSDQTIVKVYAEVKKIILENSSTRD